MKVKLKVDNVIVDSDIGMKILELLNEAESINKHWNSEQYEFIELTESHLSMSPLNMAHYAEATLNLNKTKK
jgi:hypothetical protein